MQTESKFRNLFLIRTGIGVFLFLSILSYCVNGLIISDSTPKEALILAFVGLLFLVYVSIDLFKVSSLKIMEKGIEKTSLIFRTKQYIPYSTILSIDRQKTRTRDTRGINLTDGYHFSILKYENNRRLIISPDCFENYMEIVEAIKSNTE
jgi:hypothetical protein